MKRLFIFVVAVLATSPVLAYEKVLVPVTWPGTIPGAYGSEWKIEFAIHNAGDKPATYREFPGQCGILCPSDQILPGETRIAEPIPGDERGSGAFVFFGDEDRLVTNLRVRDLSRRLSTFGTEIPIVRENDWFESRIVLFPVPTGPVFRQTLRIYDWDGRVGQSVQVRVVDIDSMDVLADALMTFSSNPGEPAYHEPGYIQLSLAHEFPQITAAEEVRVEITPVTSSRIWAFVSVTNNDTQHVTTLTP